MLVIKAFNPSSQHDIETSSSSDLQQYHTALRIETQWGKTLVKKGQKMKFQLEIGYNICNYYLLFEFGAKIRHHNRQSSDLQ